MKALLTTLLSGILLCSLIGLTGCNKASDEKITNPDLKVPEVTPTGSTVGGRGSPPKK